MILFLLFPGHDLKPREGLIKYSLAKLDAVKERPSAAKAVCLAGCNGMAEAMPLQSFHEPTLIRVSLAVLKGSVSYSVRPPGK